MTSICSVGLIGEKWPQKNYLLLNDLESYMLICSSTGKLQSSTSVMFMETCLVLSI